MNRSPQRARQARLLLQSALFGVVLIVAALTSRVTLAAGSPEPEAILAVPSSGFIGESVTFTVAFDNASANPTDVGYGPYIDLFMPISGADGLGGATDDGLSFTSATYLGAPVVNVITPCPAGSTVVHPYTGLNVSCPAGRDTQLVTLQLPFGSFVPTQPPAVITVKAALSNLADLDVPLPIVAQAGFEFGADPLDNPGGDPPVIQNPPETADLKPVLYTITKTYLGPEGETATGPSWVRQYEIVVDIANGQPLSPFVITDNLPPEIQYWEPGGAPDIVAANGVNCRATDQPTSDSPHNSAPDNLLEITCDTLTGTSGDQDLVVTFDFYVPEYYENGRNSDDWILDPANGGCKDVENDVSASGTWDPIDGRDPIVVEVETEDPNRPDDVFEACALVIQKRVNDGAFTKAGIELEYAYDIQVSDYFTLGGNDPNALTITEDVLSDGQLLLFDEYGGTGEAEMSWTDRAGSTVTTLEDGVEMDVDTSKNPHYADPPGSSTDDKCGDGTTTMTMDMTQALINAASAHPNGVIIGACVDPFTANPGDTQFPCNPSGPDAKPEESAQSLLVYRVLVQDEYACNPGDPSIDMVDFIANDVDIAGDVLDNETQTPAGGPSTDDSGVLLEIPAGELEKTVYARNGVIGDTGPFEPGDTVTYRLKYKFPVSDLEDFRFIDYLPLPVLHADDPDGDLSAGPAWSFDPTVSAAAPLAGVAKYGPDDTFNALLGGNPSPAPEPTIVANAVDNTLTFEYGDYDDPGQRASVMDILFTITVNNEPFADRLFLTNQVRAVFENTFDEVVVGDDIVQIQVLEPSLRTQKGYVQVDNTVASAVYSPANTGPVTFNQGSCPSFTGTVNSTNLAATPINSNLSGVDAGDKITAAIVVENSGSYPAYDVKLKDLLPAPINATMVSNLCVMLGDGTTTPYTGTVSDFFSGGISLTNALAAGKTRAGATKTDGKNIVIITYDVTLPSSVVAKTNYTNTTTVTNYASVSGGPDFTETFGEPTDTATFSTRPPLMAKKLVTTEIINSNNTLREAVIGEVITYELKVTFPEGATPGAVIVDTLDAGLSFVGCDSVTASGSLASNAGAFACSMFTSITNSGRTITINLGGITNSNTDNATAETVTIVYRAVVLNETINQRGQGRDNSAKLTFDTNETVGPVSADSVTIIEPALDIQKGVVVDGSGTTGDAYDTAVYTLVIQHDGISDTDAYDFTLNDPLPADFTSPSFVSVVSAGGCNYDESAFEIAGGPTLKTVNPLYMPVGCVITIKVTGTIDGDVIPGQVIKNTASIQWTSLDGKPNDDRDDYNDLGVERTGDPADTGLSANDYRDSDDADITIINPVVDKVLKSTNQAHTTDPNVAIGEIATYEVTITVPEGVFTNATVEDTLDDGLAFVDCVSITASPGLSTNAPGNFSGVCSNAVYSAVGGGATAPGRKVTYDFDTVTNTDSDDNTLEKITITYRAVVLNSMDNDRGDVRDNNVTVKADVGTFVKDGPDLVIVEPELRITKEASPITGDAGDSIEFTLTIEHTGASNADAFNVELSDILPAGDLNYVAATLDCDDGTVDPTTCAFSGNTLNATWDSFPLAGSGQTIIKFIATLDPSVSPTDVITNTAYIEWTSLPGNVGTAQSTLNPLSVERTGDPADVGGAANDHRANDPAQITVGGEPSKAVAASSEALTTPNTSLSIGEIVRYRLLYRLPEGTAEKFELIDRLPDGLQFLDDSTTKLAFVANTPGISSSALSGPGLQVIGDQTTVAGVTPTFVIPGGAISGGPFGSGTDVTFNLGTLTNADSDDNDEFVILEFNALVLNIPDNVAGDILPNNFVVEIKDSEKHISNIVNVDLIEPKVTIDKKVTTTPTDAGDTVVYEIVVSNAVASNTAPARDVRVLDVLNANLDLQSVVVNTIGPVVTNNSDTGAGNKVDVTLDPMLAGESATIVVTALVVNTAEAGAVIPNVADLDYSSLPGDNGTTPNPTGSTTPGDPGTETGERLYEGTDNVSVTLASPTVVKLAPNPTSYTIGDLVTYYIKATMPEGVTRDVVITDDLPAGLKYNSHSIVTTAVASAGNLAADFAGSFQKNPPDVDQTAGDGHDLTFSFGDITTTANNDTTNNSFLVKVVALVLNNSTPLNLAGSALTNTAKLDYVDAANQPKTVPGGSQTVNVVEPQITTDKTVNPLTGVQPGDKVMYTVTFENTGGSTAYDVTAEDILAQGVAYTTVPSPIQCKDSSNVTFPTTVTVTNAGTRLQLSGTPGNPWNLVVGNKLTCTYYVDALFNLIIGVDHVNVVDADWTSQPGTGPANEERKYDDSNPAYLVDGDQDEDDAVFTTTPTYESVCLTGVGGYERTMMFGRGMGNKTKGQTLVQISVPDPNNVVELYAQYAGKYVGMPKKVRFFTTKQPAIDQTVPVSYGYRTHAVYWYGTDLQIPVPWVKVRVWDTILARERTPRAAVIYPTYKTTELTYNAWELLEDSTKNHVFWEPTWYQTQVFRLPIATPVKAADIMVQAAVVENDKDTRPFELTIEAGGVSVFISEVAANKGDMLNLINVTLPNVPPGTKEVVFTLHSPSPSAQLLLGGDSVSLMGVAVNYSCVP
jgi:fimbrial isopeptide formation D2 family protein/uncharacterized repeat protein (TIGR01451 family)